MAADSDKTHVVVLYGGRSAEHEVSCRSAAFVLRNLDPKKYSIQAIGIDKNGVWWPQDTQRLLPDLPTSVPIETDFHAKVAIGSVDIASLVPTARSEAQGVAKVSATANVVVFPVLHGTFGEDGTMQGLLELADVAFVGADTLGSAIGMDKVVTKRLAKAAGIPVVPWLDFRAAAVTEGGKALEKRIARELGLPLFVKPARLGSSVGIAKVKREEDLGGALADALRYDDKILIEKGLNAREIECAALGGYDPRVSVAGEIVPHREFYDYVAKYEDPNGATLVVPAKLTPEQLKTIQDLTRRAFIALELFGMARVDFFLDKDDGLVYFNEVNTLPGFTSISQYPMLWAASGVSSRELVETLIAQALERQANKRKLTRSK